MKKLLSLVLAAAMVLALGAVAFAATEEVTEPEMIWGVEDSYYGITSDGVIAKAKSIDTAIPYGSTRYFALFCEDNLKYTGDLSYNFGTTVAPNVVVLGSASELVYRYDVIKGIKPKMSYEMGGSMIDSVEIVKKKQSFSADPFYAYFLAVKVKASSTTSKTDVIGEITMKKSDQVRDDSELVDGADFSITLGYADAESLDIDDDAMVFDFSDIDGVNEEDEETELELYGEAGYFVVNTIGQGDLVLASDTDFNSDVAALYPDANLDFVIGNGASFNKTGELYLYADEGTYLYALKSDGTLAAVKAEYDEYEEAFVVKTRTLGSYVISDIELDLAPAVVEPTEPTEPTTPANPSTGAAA